MTAGVRKRIRNTCCPQRRISACALASGESDFLNIFLISSFVLYFIMMFLVMRFNKAEYRRTRKGTRLFFAGMGVFVLLMVICYANPTVSIGVTVVYIWAVFVSLWKMSRQDRDSK